MDFYKLALEVLHELPHLKEKGASVDELAQRLQEQISTFSNLERLNPLVLWMEQYQEKKVRDSEKDRKSVE